MARCKSCAGLATESITSPRTRWLAQSTKSLENLPRTCCPGPKALVRTTDSRFDSRNAAACLNIRYEPVVGDCLTELDGFCHWALRSRVFSKAREGACFCS